MGKEVSEKEETSPLQTTHKCMADYVSRKPLASRFEPPSLMFQLGLEHFQ